MLIVNFLNLASDFSKSIFLLRSSYTTNYDLCKHQK